MAEFSYNNSKHSATTLSSFFANYGFHPRMLPPFPDSTTPAADSYVAQLRKTQTTLQTELLKARKAMELSANRKRRPAPDFTPGQQVWLLRRNISTTRPSSKLDVRRLGPFPIIERVGTSAFRLDLPRSMHIHPVFHVSLLELHVANTFPFPFLSQRGPSASPPCGWSSRVRGAQDYGLQVSPPQATLLCRLDWLPCFGALVGACN